MKTYLVGGAVRDQLSGVTPKDHDYVVVDSDASEMQARGFMRVGANYEVFIHPKTKEEYVLAHDLIDDLRRRDLTINSMAIDENGNLIDPFGGKADLEAKILRHTSSHFSDDPLRVYRLARFRAQWPDFRIEEATVETARQLSKSRAFKELHGNRIFNELRLALEAVRASNFFATLEQLGGRLALFEKVETWAQLDQVQRVADLRFAFLAMSMESEEIDVFCENLFVPREWKLEAKAASHARKILSIKNRTPENIVDFFYAIDAFRKPEFISFLSQLCGEKFTFLREAFFKVKDVPLPKGLTGKEISAEIRRQRCQLLQ